MGLLDNIDLKNIDLGGLDLKNLDTSNIGSALEGVLGKGVDVSSITKHLDLSKATDLLSKLKGSDPAKNAEQIKAVNAKLAELIKKAQAAKTAKEAAAKK